MAWRPTRNLTAGEVDNTTPGRVTGKLCFIGLAGVVSLDLAGDFQGALRGRRIKLTVTGTRPLGDHDMAGFSRSQTGKLDACYRLSDGGLHLSWYSDVNGRVVLELPASDFEVMEG